MACIVRMEGVPALGEEGGGEVHLYGVDLSPTLLPLLVALLHNILIRLQSSRLHACMHVCVGEKVGVGACDFHECCPMLDGCVSAAGRPLTFRLAITQFWTVRTMESREQTKGGDEEEGP